MSACLAAKLVKARKPHKCTWCGEMIESGEQYHRRAGIDDDGLFWTMEIHLECLKAEEEILRKDPNYYDETWEPYQCKRGSVEFKQ